MSIVLYVLCSSAAAAVAIGQLQLQPYRLFASRNMTSEGASRGLEKNFLGSLSLAIFSGPLINYAIIRPLVVEEFKANPSSSRSLGGNSPNHNQTVGLYAAIKFSRNAPEPVSGVLPPKLPFHHLKLSLHHLAIQFGQLIFGSGKSL